VSGADRRVEAISAVVCNYEGAAYLEECVGALLDEECIDEVLVVDNGSKDGSVALLRERFPDVRVVALEENGGPCVARNVGMREAAHRWVLAVDNDAVVTPGMTEALRAALEADPGVAVAMPRSVMYAERDRVHYDSGWFHYCGLLSLRNFYVPLAEAQGSGVVDVDALIAISPLVDRDALLGIGGYDEDFFYLAEDFDLALRLRQAGHRLVAVEEALVLHKGGTEGLSFRGGGYPRRRAYLHARNRWILIAKCYAGRTLLVVAPGLLVYELVFTLFSLLQGHLFAQLAGKRDALASWGRLRTKRRAVQAARRVADRELLVGGPLTISPSLVASGPARLAIGLVDACLRAWWGIARRLAG